MWSNCLLDLGTDFLVGNMVLLRDAWYLAVADFHGLLVRAPDSRSKGWEFKSRQERRENFLL